MQKNLRTRRKKTKNLRANRKKATFFEKNRQRIDLLCQIIIGAIILAIIFFVENQINERIKQAEELAQFHQIEKILVKKIIHTPTLEERFWKQDLDKISF
jgi:hypothetical protein